MLQIVIMANHTWRSEYNMTEFIACLNSTMSNANCVQVALQCVTAIQYFSRSKFRPVWCSGWSRCSTAQEGNGSTISVTVHCFQPYKLLYWHASCKLCPLHYKKDLLLPTSYVGGANVAYCGGFCLEFFFPLLSIFCFNPGFQSTPILPLLLFSIPYAMSLFYSECKILLLFSSHLNGNTPNMNSAFMSWVST